MSVILCIINTHLFVTVAAVLSVNWIIFVLIVDVLLAVFTACSVCLLFYRLKYCNFVKIVAHFCDLTSPYC